MCKAARLSLVLDLGHQPHSDSFPLPEELDRVEVTYPLRLCICEGCGLLQIDYFVDPKILYQDDYLYQSSTTETGKKHYRDMANVVKEKFSIPQGKFVVDIGSNVGVLLSGFKEIGFRVLGVDPAKRAVDQAQKNGIDTVLDFFTADGARRIRSMHGAADVITGTNVFAHLHELDDAVVGMRELLAQDGVIVIEAPHALTMIEGLEYDTIYHQHIAYLSAKPMEMYLKSRGLELFDIDEISIHGGSLRYYVGHPHAQRVQKTVSDMIAHEEAHDLYSLERLKKFATDVRMQKQRLVEMIIDLKKQGKRIIALSAPAKGNTLLNYCHLDRDYLEYATEKNPLKVGRFTPGMHIPIYSDEKILEDQPDYALILAWNFSDEIIANMSEYRMRGGKFIIPIPEPSVV